jgi:hypothetical protein
MSGGATSLNDDRNENSGPTPTPSGVCRVTDSQLVSPSVRDERVYRAALRAGTCRSPGIPSDLVDQGLEGAGPVSQLEQVVHLRLGQGLLGPVDGAAWRGWQRIRWLVVRKFVSVKETNLPAWSLARAGAPTDTNQVDMM